VKILLLNQSWFAQEWREMGHQVITCCYFGSGDIKIPSFFSHIDTIIKLLPEGFIPDILILHDNSGPISILGLETLKIPLVFYSVDIHHHFTSHNALFDFFDISFVAQRDYLKDLNCVNEYINWLPLWAPIIIEPEREKKYDATFVGTLNPTLNPERVDFFSNLEKITPISIFSGNYIDYFPKAKIVVNQTVKSDLNFRVFESLMCGTLLITEKTDNGLNDLFLNKLDLRLYNKNDYHEVANLIKYYLARPEELNKIATTGRAKILNSHTSYHRAKEMLEKIFEQIKSINPLKRRKPLLPMVIQFARFALLTKEVNPSISKISYLHAAQYLFNALNNGERCNDETIFSAVISCLGYSRYWSAESGVALLSLLSDNHPQFAAPVVGTIAEFLLDGKIEEATKLANATGISAITSVADLFKPLLN
jgi:hypothetical protein